MAGDDRRFLLHLWHDERGDVRASLRDIADGRLRLFADLGDLSTFLQASTDVPGVDLDTTEDGRPGGGGIA